VAVSAPLMRLAPGDEEPRLFEVPASAIVVRDVPTAAGMTAFYHGYLSTRTVLLHVLRDVPVKRNRYPYDDEGHDWGQGWCGTSACNTTRSVTQFLDPLPARPPEGLDWCPKCLGHLAKRLGLLTVVGEMLAAAA
jgi:hypothetical protein